MSGNYNNGVKKYEATSLVYAKLKSMKRIKKEIPKSQ